FGVLGEQRLVWASQVPWFSHWPAGVQVTAWFELHGPAAHPSAWMQTVAAPPLFSTFGSLSEVTFQTLVNLAPSPSSAGTCSTSSKTALAPEAKVAIVQELPLCMLEQTKVGPLVCTSETNGGSGKIGSSSESTTLVASPGPPFSSTIVNV